MLECTPASATPWWVSAAIFATSFGALAFVFAYARLAPWRSTPMGRHVMTFMVVILVVATLASVSAIFGNNWPFRSQIRFACWAAVAGVIWRRIWLLVQAQRGKDLGHPQATDPVPGMH